MDEEDRTLVEKWKSVIDIHEALPEDLKDDTISIRDSMPGIRTIGEFKKLMALFESLSASLAEKEREIERATVIVDVLERVILAARDVDPRLIDDLCAKYEVSVS